MALALCFILVASCSILMFYLMKTIEENKTNNETLGVWLKDPNNEHREGTIEYDSEGNVYIHTHLHMQQKHPFTFYTEKYDVHCFHVGYTYHRVDVTKSPFGVSDKDVVLDFLATFSKLVSQQLATEKEREKEIKERNNEKREELRAMISDQEKKHQEKIIKTEEIVEKLNTHLGNKQTNIVIHPIKVVGGFINKGWDYHDIGTPYAKVINKKSPLYLESPKTCSKKIEDSKISRDKPRDNRTRPTPFPDPNQAGNISTSMFM